MTPGLTLSVWACFSTTAHISEGTSACQRGRRLDRGSWWVEGEVGQPHALTADMYGPRATAAHLSKPVYRLRAPCFINYLLNLSGFRSNSHSHPRLSLFRRTLYHIYLMLNHAKGLIWSYKCFCESPQFVKHWAIYSSDKCTLSA